MHWLLQDVNTACTVPQRMRETENTKALSCNIMQIMQIKYHSHDLCWTFTQGPDNPYPCCIIDVLLIYVIRVLQGWIHMFKWCKLRWCGWGERQLDLKMTKLPCNSSCFSFSKEVLQPQCKKWVGLNSNHCDIFLPQPTKVIPCCVTAITGGTGWSHEILHGQWDT